MDTTSKTCPNLNTAYEGASHNQYRLLRYNVSAITHRVLSGPLWITDRRGGVWRYLGRPQAKMPSHGFKNLFTENNLADQLPDRTYHFPPALHHRGAGRRSAPSSPWAALSSGPRPDPDRSSWRHGYRLNGDMGQLVVGRHATKRRTRRMCRPNRLATRCAIQFRPRARLDVTPDIPRRFRKLFARNAFRLG